MNDYSPRPDLPQSDRDEAKRNAEIRTVLAIVEDHKNLLGPGIDPVTVAEAMRDIARMQEKDRTAMFIRRMTPPSPWVRDFGRPEDKSMQEEIAKKRPTFRPPASITNPESESRGLDPSNVFAQEAINLKYEKM